MFKKINAFFDKFFTVKGRYPNAAENEKNYLADVMLLSYLKEIDSKKDKTHGICHELVMVSVADEDYGYGQYVAIRNRMQTAFTHWPLFSGNQTFPVPAPLGWVDDEDGPAEARAYISATIGLPRWEGEYGRNRQNLLDFLIVYFANKVANAPYFPGKEHYDSPNDKVSEGTLRQGV